MTTQEDGPSGQYKETDLAPVFYCPEHDNFWGNWVQGGNPVWFTADAPPGEEEAAWVIKHRSAVCPKCAEDEGEARLLIVDNQQAGV
jgi:hypothetical protein